MALIVRCVFEALEIPSPCEPEAPGGLADLGVDGRVGEVGLALEKSDVPGCAKVVVGKSGAGIGDLWPRCGAAFGVERVLLVVAAESADDTHHYAVLACNVACEAHKLSRVVLRGGVQGRDVAGGAFVEGHLEEVGLGSSGSV